MPNYAIKNNVVVVSHEVNIGHIDNEKIFYMQAKGISKNDAIKIIINSMFAPIASTNINDIELNILFNSMKEKIQELLAL
jgi:Fe-S cluster assembly scaffold protein SufB